MVYKIFLASKSSGQEIRTILVSLSEYEFDCQEHPEVKDNPAEWYVGQGFTVDSSGEVNIEGDVELLGETLIDGE